MLPEEAATEPLKSGEIGSVSPCRGDKGGGVDAGKKVIRCGIHSED